MPMAVGSFQSSLDESNVVFNTTTGHDHDGTDSKLISFVGHIIQVGFAGNASVFGPSSTAWEDITGVSVTMTTGASDLIIIGRCRAITYTGSGGAGLTHALDGTTDETFDSSTHPNYGISGSGESIDLTYMNKISVSAGSHTITLRGADAPGGNNGYADTILLVMEVHA